MNLISALILLVAAQAFLEKESLKVTVLRVIDADTYMVKYRNDVFNVRLRNPDPKDTIDTWDKNLRQARKQSARYGISVDSVRSLGNQATAYMDSLLTGKRVILRRYPDQFSASAQWSYNRLLRGVEIDGAHISTIIPSRFIAK
jgi:hypothetical protein